MNIFCPKKLLAEFRRECRKRFPNEHFAALYGHRSDAGNVMLTRVSPVAHTSDADGVNLKHKNGILRSKIAALRLDEEFLGTIHSHCFRPEDPTCWHLSAMDIRTALEWGETICGLVYVDDGGRHTDVHWYVPAPIPVVIYG